MTVSRLSQGKLRETMVVGLVFGVVVSHNRLRKLGKRKGVECILSELNEENLVVFETNVGDEISFSQYPHRGPEPGKENNVRISNEMKSEIA